MSETSAKTISVKAVLAAALLSIICIAALISVQLSHHSAVHFLVTADPQFGASNQDNKDDLDYRLTWNQTSRRTLQVMAAKKSSHTDIRGILVAGDLTNNSQPYGQYDLYKSSLNPVGAGKNQANALRFVYDGIGNHDMVKASSLKSPSANAIACQEHSVTCVSTALIREELATRQRDTLPFLRQGLHYAWRWGDVTFVHLNLFPGDTAGPHGKRSPDRSLTFLQNVIQTLDKPKDRLIILHHYTFNKGAIADPEDWWTEEQMERYWNSIAETNLLGIFTGHSHRRVTTNPQNNFLRPKNSTLGPAFIPAFVTGSAGQGLYLDVKISKTRMVVQPMQVTASGAAASGEPIQISLS